MTRSQAADTRRRRTGGSRARARPARASASSGSAAAGRCGTSGATGASRTGTSTSSATSAARRSASTSSTRSSTSSCRPTAPCAGRTRTSSSRLRGPATSTRTRFARRRRRCSPIRRGRRAGRTGLRIPPGRYADAARRLGRGLKRRSVPKSRRGLELPQAIRRAESEGLRHAHRERPRLGSPTATTRRPSRPRSRCEERPATRARRRHAIPTRCAPRIERSRSGQHGMKEIKSSAQRHLIVPDAESVRRRGGLTAIRRILEELERDLEGADDPAERRLRARRASRASATWTITGRSNPGVRRAPDSKRAGACSTGVSPLGFSISTQAGVLGMRFCSGQRPFAFRFGADDVKRVGRPAPSWIPGVTVERRVERAVARVRLVPRAGSSSRRRRTARASTASASTAGRGSSPRKYAPRPSRNPRWHRSTRPSRKAPSPASRRGAEPAQQRVGARLRPRHDPRASRRRRAAAGSTASLRVAPPAARSSLQRGPGRYALNGHGRGQTPAMSRKRRLWISATPGRTPARAPPPPRASRASASGTRPPHRRRRRAAPIHTAGDHPVDERLRRRVARRSATNTEASTATPNTPPSSRIALFAPGGLALVDCGCTDDEHDVRDRREEQRHADAGDDERADELGVRRPSAS